MTDDFTDFTVVYLLKKKSELKKVLGDYLVMMKTQGTPVQRLRSDNGGEYAGAETIFLLENFGVEWEPTAPYNPNQNGVAERCFRTLFERARAILADSKLPANQWGEAISTITYLKNRSPTTALKGITPYQAWYGKKPDLSNLHVFGSVAYHHVEGDRRKLDDKSLRCRFLGYSEINQFRLWTGNKVIVSSHVLWDEAVATEVGENEENEDYSFLDFDVPGTSNTNTDDDTVKQDENAKPRVPPPAAKDGGTVTDMSNELDSDEENDDISDTGQNPNPRNPNSTIPGNGETSDFPNLTTTDQIPTTPPRVSTDEVAPLSQPPR
jgi:hypothetical protein